MGGVWAAPRAALTPPKRTPPSGVGTPPGFSLDDLRFIFSFWLGPGKWPISKKPAAKISIFLKEKRKKKEGEKKRRGKEKREEGGEKKREGGKKKGRPQATVPGVFFLFLITNSVFPNGIGFFSNL